MAKILTAAAVERLRPGSLRREVRDAATPGLHLIVQASGVKSWALRYRRPGTRKNVKLTLGRADVTSRDPLPEPAVGGFPHSGRGARPRGPPQPRARDWERPGGGPAAPEA